MKTSQAWLAVFLFLLGGLLTFHFTLASQTVAALPYSELPECGPGEGFICPATSPGGTQYQANPTCKDPSFVLDLTGTEWVHSPNADCNALNSGGTTKCLTFRHEDLEWRNTFLAKWPVTDPATPTGMPSYTGINAPYRKYDPFYKRMVSCNPDVAGPYLGIPRRNYDPLCRQIPDEDVDEWAKYYEADYEKHNIAWDVCNQPAPQNSASKPLQPEIQPQQTNIEQLLALVSTVDAQIEATQCTRRSVVRYAANVRKYVVRAQSRIERERPRSAAVLLNRAYSNYRKIGSVGRRCGITIDRTLFKDLIVN
ncbi:hypothetical protein COV82_03670 [Candidatus Peregrinibacteria bacterium CG11_big_fil_rev_8_21_14_0_20_46_8]|nr:MAG: hypothetical protein COV82_03670 [Candidatus Peregrinibacteria bacterium CG11_big_fil_rev_8_21_14_0_20_46_8]